MALWARRIGRAHKILGLVVGLQLLFWTASGLFFTLYPIETIRGDPYRPVVDHGALDPTRVVIGPAQAAERVAGTMHTITLKMFLGEPVWLIRTDEERVMVDAISGDIRSPVTDAEVERIVGEGEAERSLGEVERIFLMEADAPREYGGPLPAWVVEYAPGGQRVYVDAMTGDVVSVRTANWRVFDVLWRFHIMDVTGEDRFDSWWLKLFAFLGLTTVLFGIALIVDRALKGRLFS